MSTIITPSEEQINIVVNDEKISINVESGDVIVNVNEQIVEVSTVNGGYPLPTTVYSVFGRTGNIIATEGDYDLGELGDVTLVSTTNGDVLTYDGTKWINKAVSGTGTVTSVDMSVPVGLQVSGNPIVTNGTLALNYAAGYSLPTTAKQTTWDGAYNDSIVSASVSGTTTKTLTLNQQDGGTITASWTDIDTNLVTSVNGYVGTVVLTTSDIAEGSRLYYTETRVSNNVDVAANTAARHSAVTIGTANGLSLASQVLSLALASASTTGALSSTDWATFNNKVPYSGATGNVTLGEYQLSAGQVAFDQSPTGTAGVGILRWNDSDGTLDLGLKGGNVTLQVGQEMVARVVNKTGADLLESGYKVVRISSAQGQRLAVQLAQANNDTNSTDTIGIVTETIANNQEGFITILGQVKEINTTGSLQGETWADGDVLYLSPTTAGNITNIKPVAPSHMVVVGYVEYAHSQHGKIYCKTQNGYELEELHNVLISSVANNEGLFYESATSLWKNKSIATVLGYTPISLTSLSGVSPLSYNNTTGAFSIAQATTSANGYLSSTDWNTFNSKQAAGNYITALSGEATASGPGSAAVTLSTSSVTGKLLTGVNITGGSISATDSILVAFGKVQNQINGVLGGAIYQSTWNASTNSPTLTSSTGTKGYYYIVSVAGSTNLDGITDWKVGDWAIFNGATWDKVDNTDAVSSVNGFTGAVSLTTANISEVTNLYYTEGRVSANTDVAANTAARHSAVTLGTANGLSLSTQALSLALASTSATGALSSTDWNTFNLKQAALSGTGFVKISGSTISYDNSTYLTGNQTITLSGDVSGSGATAITTTIGALKVTNAMLAGSIDLTTKVTGLLPDGNISSAATWNAKQAQLNGTGFVKASGTTITYDNSTYLTTSAASSTYLPLTGGTLTGALNINLSSGTALNVAGNAIFRGDTGVGTPRQLIITSGGSTPVYLEAKGYGANYQTDFGIKTFNSVGTAFEVFYADSSGRVGINQTSPSYQLDVNGTGRFSSNLYVSGGTNTNVGNGIHAYYESSYAQIQLNGATGSIIDFSTSGTDFLGRIIYTNATNQFEFKTNSAGTAALTLASTGAATFTGNITVDKSSPNISINAPSGTSGQYNINNGVGSLMWAMYSTTGGSNAQGNWMLYSAGKTGGAGNIIDITPAGAATFSSSVTATQFNVSTSGGTTQIYNTGGGHTVITNATANKDMNIQTSGTGGQYFNTAGVDRLIISSTGAATFSSSVQTGGNVGINIAPSAFYSLIVKGAATTSASYGGYISAGTNSSDTSFVVEPYSGASTYFKIRGDGNVGIGTSSPATKFVISNAGAEGLEFIPADSSNYNRIQSYSRSGGVYNTLETRASIHIWATDATERMRITSDGNLLLGTTDNGSGAKLVFYSTTAAQQLKAAGTAPAITFSNTITSPTIGGSLGVATSAGQFLSGTAAGDMILINQFTGNKLYITNYSGGVYLTQGATSWTANSDIRLKNINSHIENAVEKLSTLQTINFSYKDDKTNKQNLGLIAQEVEKIFPELIDKNGDGMLGVRYTELVPVLIKAIQEQQKEINELKLKIK
jgi:hypothetical protein